MNCNVGGIDRTLRIIAGLAIIAWGVMAGNMWGAVGLVPLVTGLMKWCPLYSIIGLKTCSVDKNTTLNHS
ncbi:MAG TPA: DUF2892 domain-containing protein [Gammaproteobacteria bacterium]|nr:DUF2892 domain-containing protein [Gammaproteobacteria bacterium]